ncbi:MAG: TolC family protein [Gemmatimonadota bacterium]
MIRQYLAAAVGLAVPGALVAQQPEFTLPPPAPVEATLTLKEALEQARTSSPDFRLALTNVDPAHKGLRTAYGAFVPTLGAGIGAGYTGSGTAQFGGSLTNETPSVYNSSYSFQANWTLNGRVLNGPGQQRASVRAVNEDVANAEVLLRSSVTTQYLTALEQAGLVDVQRKQVERNEEFLKLARARYQVGQGTLLDVRQAEVQLAQAQVGFLRAAQAAIDAKLELYRLIGVSPPVPVERIALTDPFTVEPPTFNREQLIQLAAQENPALKAELARLDARKYGARAAKSEWMPSLNANASLSGFTQQFSSTDGLVTNAFRSARSQAASCEFDNQVRQGLNLGGINPDCNGTAGLTPDGQRLLPSVEQQIKDRNGKFPFRFTRQPFQLNVSLSYNIFDGFGRSLRISQARAAEDAQAETVRRQALRVRTSVEQRYYQIEIAYRAIEVQEKNRQAAAEQLRLAQERYRVGSGTALDIIDAQNSVQRAEGDYISAVYGYHRAIAALEEAVGRPLR